MKFLLRSLFLNSLILYLAILVYPGFIFDNLLQTLLLAALTLTLLNRVVKPLLKLLLLPINLLTLGIFGWVVNVAALFILTRVVTGFSVIPFKFAGFEYQGFIIPPLFLGIFASYVLGSLTLSLISHLLTWLLKR